MARSRTLKPEFWTDDVIVELSFAARLFYQGYWNFALCDYGHSDATAKSLKMKIFPADDVNAEELIEELVKHGRLLRRTTPDGRAYLHAATLSKHTKMDTRWNTRCPYCALEGNAKPVSAPPSTVEPAETHASLSEPTETHSSKGKEGKGKEGSSASRSASADADGAALFEAPEGDQPPPNSGRLVAYWLERCKARPPGRVVGHMSREIKNLLDEGIDSEFIKLGIDDFLSKDLSPGNLPSLVNSAMNRRPRASPAPGPEPAYFRPLGGES